MCIVFYILKLFLKYWHSKGVYCFTGVTETKLSKLLKHLIYDGVYASMEERVAGGGSLELRKHIIKELGLDEDDITGNWDYAHNMQLVWSDALNKKPFCLKIIKVYYSAMKSMHCGKASTHFMEKAKDLENLVLTNQKVQTTRFVRSLQRGNSAVLRNLPTLVSVIAEEYQEAALQSKITFSSILLEFWQISYLCLSNCLLHV